MGQIGRRIRSLRKTAGLTQGDLARAADVTVSAVTKWETTEIDPRADVIQLIAKALHVTTDDLLGQHDLTNRPIRSDPTPAADLQRMGIEAYPVGPTVLLPIIGEIRCGPGGIVDERHDGTMAIDIEMFHTILPDLKHWYWLRIVGDSMVDAGYHDGGLALVHKQDTVESGEIAVVLLEDEESATLKRVIWHQELNAVELRPENERYEAKFLPIGSVHIIGKTKGAFMFDDMKA